MAYESDLVGADGVVVTEFPHLAQRYTVMAVPKTVANEKTALEGLAPEGAFLDAVMGTLERKGS